MELGPWHVAMSSQTAASIDRRTGADEFAPAGTHTALKYVPCGVASAVANRAANAWTAWAANSGTVGVSWEGYSSGPYFGRFVCSGTSRSDGGASEICTHFADRHAGQITVRFTIYPAPSD